MEERKAEGNSLSKKPRSLAQFTDFGQFSDLETFDWRISWFLRRKDLAFLWFFPKGPLAIYSCNCTLGKGNNDTFQGLLDIGSELTLIPRNPNHHYGLSVGLGACDGQVISEVPAKVQFTVDPLGPRTQAMVISPVLHQYAYYKEKKKGLGLQEVWVKRKSKNKAQEGMLSDSLHLTNQDSLSARRQAWGGGEIVASSQYLWSSHFMGQAKVQRKSDIKWLPLPIFTPNCHFTYYL